jgi:hypothetical protein
LNYARIYSEFIANRRATENAQTSFTELHHVLPRCLGGTDSASNLIALKPEDHLFAHLLLAKIYREARLWYAVIMMVGKEKYRGRKAREVYGWTRRMYAESVKDRPPTNLDTTSYV